MFSNMKLANKVIMAFILLIAITSFVCYSGFNGMTDIMKETDDIAKIFLPSIKSILELQIAQSNITVGVRGLINRRMMADPAMAKAQIDFIETNFKAADVAWKIYEPLPQVEKETKVWNEFIPKWNEWKKGVEEIKSFISEKEKLTAAGVKVEDNRVVELDSKTYSAYIKYEKLDEEIDKMLNEISSINDQGSTNSVKKVDAVFESSKNNMLYALGFGIFLAIVTGWFLALNVKNIIDGLIEESKKLTEAAVGGKLDARGDLSKINFEFRGVVEGVNNTLDAVIKPLNVAAEYVDRISKGDVPQKISDDYKGDFNEIKNNLNQCIDAINFLVADTITLSKAAIEGKLVTRADASKHRGDFKKVVEGVNNTLDAVIGPLNVAAECVDKISKGNIPEKITDNYNGDFNTIKNNLNQCIDAVNALITDANMLAQAAVDGMLQTRADASKHQGDFRSVIEGVNITLDAVIGPVKKASECLQKMANGNLDVCFDGGYQGDHATLKNAINDTLNSMNDILNKVSEAVKQVNVGAKQVSDASQSLSEAATESASSLEEISASMHEISSQARQNADNATQANGLASNVRYSADEGNHKMCDMQKAMAAINESATNVAKIIKAIDEIAFQTNLLALNAAVEAARAGKHGKGFTVVAEEVRNLAQRSAKAAKETAEMIESSIKKAGAGSKIADETARSFGEIVNGVTKVTDLVGEIASASKEQEHGVSLVNTNISQVDKATQQNTATAEEAAAASEELSAQAVELSVMLKRFKLKKISGSVNAYVSRENKAAGHETFESLNYNKKTFPKPEIKKMILNTDAYNTFKDII